MIKTNLHGQFFVAIVGILLLISCQSGDTNSKELSLSISGVKDGESRLVKFYDYKMGVLDSVEVTANGKVELKRTWQEPQIVYIHEKISNQKTKFLSEVGKIEIELSLNNDSTSTEPRINYSTQKTHLPAFKAYDAKMKDFFKKSELLNKQWEELRKKYDYKKIPSEARASLDSAFNKFYDDKNAYFKEYVATKNNLISQFLYLTDLRFYASKKGLEKVFEETSEDLKQTSYYKALLSKYDIIKNIEIGATAPEIVRKDTLGNEVALSSLRGKYVLIDFWASWCGPCRKENPWVKKAYKQFHDKGFEVYALSLDFPGQKKEWVAAIKKDGLPWYHVSALKGWKDPMVKTYNISGIPSPFLIDPQGKIVVKGDDLREEKLIKTLTKYLGK